MIELRVKGIPPSKNEAMSLLGKGHSHIARVVALLESAQRAANSHRLTSFKGSKLRMEVIVSAPEQAALPDATNLLGGIADVLQARKSHVRRPLDHLGQLAEIHVFDDDANIIQIEYRREKAAAVEYVVRIIALN